MGSAMRSLASKKAVIALIVLMGSPLARASLGGVEATVEADRLAASATATTQRSDRFTVHELQTPSGTKVREYVSPAGVVFGVAWRGPSMPDLRQLLGDHFQPYVDAMAARRTRRSPVFIELPGFVFQSSGHMRAFAGKAYLSSALPQGVAAREIQ
jgi:hypothetical protein